MVTASTWAIPLLGMRRDLEDWKDALPSGGDPWVEIMGVEVVLRSASFDGLVEERIWTRAQRVIRLARGAVAALGAYTEIGFNEVLQLLPDEPEPRRTTQIGDGSRSSRRDMFRSLGGSKRLGAANAPSLPQRWIGAASRDEDLADALTLLAGDLDWYDIYKLVECLEHKYGGEHKLLAMKWLPEGTKKLKKEANYRRHRRRLSDKRLPALTLRQGQKQIEELVRLALEDETSKR